MATTLDRSGDLSLWRGLVGDGRPALAAVGASLAFAGGLAVYLGLTRQLLPHDLAYLEMTAAEVESIAGGRLMDFMVHDRVSWGGSLLAVGIMYMWLTAFPLARRQRWAWLTMAVSGFIGFSSFLSHLPTGYLDTWHGTGTLLLVPVFLVGLWLTWPEPGQAIPDRGLLGMTWGRRIVVATGAGLVISGAVIMAIGATTTFVASDLDFIGMGAEELDAVDDRLIPLVAHDRVGFAGGVIVGGLLMAAVAMFGEGRAARQAVAVAGIAGFGLALGIHLLVGYTDVLHLAPSLIGPVALLTGVAMWGREAGD